MTARILFAALILAGTVALAWYGTRWVNRMDRRATQPQGATEEYAVELRAMRDVEVSPELISDTEMDLAWGLLWHQFEHSMQEEINRVFAPLLAALPVEVHSFPAVMALVDGADKMPTGEWPRVVLV